ncbi:hypothetical protein HRbin22_01075 [Candidatus Thermoflexus japonica]|uniref:Uncharacterized protein n=1 Tax=Candidatus Thermoflexus japonica TaxID=2035417 RepID=A0A2H5Y5V9_9CHLR|nr:hypothetical protein HRbin22_01075 [Candidatus Thermoflexus japonica]
MTFHEERVEAVGRAIPRRQFLVRLGAAVLGMVATWVGGHPPRVSAAGGCPGGVYIRGCCTLCCPPGSAYDNLPNCAPGQPYRTKWCWYCVDNRGFSYRCCEAYEPNVPDSQRNYFGSCIAQVFAFWYEFLGPHSREKD